MSEPFRLMLDNTRKSLWQECKRKSLYRDFCGLKPIRLDSSGLEFGKAIHIGTEVIDKTGDVNLAKETFSSVYPDCYSSHKVRSIARGHELLEAYYEFVSERNFDFILPEGEGAELSFQVPVTSEIYHVGRCDRFLRDGTPIEIKTTYYLYDKFGSSLDYLTSWQGHASIQGYAWITKATQAGVIGLGVYPQIANKSAGKKEAKICLPAVDYLIWTLEEDELEVWQTEIVSVGTEILEWYDKYGLHPQDYHNNLDKVLKDRLHIHFPRNTNRCNDYHSVCQYRDLCLRNLPDGMIEPYYYINPFEPWKCFKDDNDNTV